MMKTHCVFSLVILLYATSILASTPPVSCQQVIQAADQALAAKETEVKSLTALRLQMESNQKDLQVRLADRDSALSSPLHNPLVTTLIGVLAGGLAVALVRAK